MSRIFTMLFVGLLGLNAQAMTAGTDVRSILNVDRPVIKITFTIQLDAKNKSKTLQICNLGNSKIYDLIDTASKMKDQFLGGRITINLDLNCIEDLQINYADMIIEKLDK